MWRFLKGKRHLTASASLYTNWRTAIEEEEGFQASQYVQVSPGDGGLSYGQGVIAATVLRKGKSF